MSERASDRISNPGVRAVVQRWEDTHEGDLYQYTTAPSSTDYYVFNSGRYSLVQVQRGVEHPARRGR